MLALLPILLRMAESPPPLPGSDPPTGETSLEALKKRALRAVWVLVPTLISALLVILQGKAETGEVKDKAESGYQATRAALLEVREGLKVIVDEQAKQKAEIAALKRAARAGRRPAAMAAPTPAPALTVPVQASLPKDLDKALVEQQAKAP